MKDFYFLSLIGKGEKRFARMQASKIGEGKQKR